MVLSVQLYMGMPPFYRKNQFTGFFASSEPELIGRMKKPSKRLGIAFVIGIIPVFLTGNGIYLLPAGLAAIWFGLSLRSDLLETVCSSKLNAENRLKRSIVWFDLWTVGIVGVIQLLFIIN
ncbi:hypothetical protein N9K16_03825 [Alphaproteobacteria bacterium]|nr:hypothetical protein [Alphaproteobacteria bacterium]